jgi:hypothetical protein
MKMLFMACVVEPFITWAVKSVKRRGSSGSAADFENIRERNAIEAMKERYFGVDLKAWFASP